MSSAIYSAFLCILLLGGIVSPSRADAATTILLFGDSLTAGYGLNREEALPEQVEKLLRERKHDVNVINGGVSGDTTSGGRNRLAWMLERHKPDIVLVALGGNDMLRAVAPDVTRANLDHILTMLKEKNVKTILMEVKVPPNYDSTYEQAFNRIYPELAEKYNVALYPFFLEALFGRSDYLLQDGVHPNAKGVAYVAGYLTDYMEKTGWF